ncbi:MAG TPA: MBL fold metallo-hydrolase, partial [Telmatospirillum sp.]|nr:MBL fold metallo-hydrolase [Telmatospirillum sp.]
MILWNIMRTSKWNIPCALAVLAVMSVADAQTARPVPDSIEGHLAAGKNAAGGRDNTADFYGLVTAICVAPLNTPARPDAPAPRMNPNRASAYLEPKKAFDDLYWMGTPSRSTWALTTSDGIILYDTQGVYDAEDVIVGGLKKLGLDPAKVKYVIISHAHENEVGGAKLMQERYGAHIVMGAGDWDMVDQSVNGFPNGKPKRDIVATDGMKIALGGRTVTIYLMPGHTPGTISGIFQVHDQGKPLTVAYSGGTEFNFVNDVPHFDAYLASERKFAAIAAAAGATIVMGNQSQFDSAAPKLRALADRRSGEAHPLDVGAGAVARYFKIEDECAQAVRLRLLAQQHAATQP